METERRGENHSRQTKGVEEDEGQLIESTNNSKMACTGKVKSREDFKAPLLPNRKMKSAAPKLNGHVTPNDLLAVEQPPIETNGGELSELLDPFVNIGKHCYLCPHSRQYIASTCPSSKKKRPESNGTTLAEEFDMVKEVIVDDFSLLLFHSAQDYTLFKESEDELREREEAEGRRRLAEEKRRLYEENLLLGRVKRKGRRCKKDLEREQKETRRQEKLERREQRRRATLEQRVQRKRERREHRNLEEGDLSLEEKAARRLARREAREERQRLKQQRKQEEKRLRVALRRQAKLQLQQQQDAFQPPGEQLATTAKAKADCCEPLTATSMARGLSTPMPGSNSQPPSVGHAAAGPQSGAHHPNGGASSSSIVRLNHQPEVASKGEEAKAGVKRSFSTIGIAQAKAEAALDGGDEGRGGSSAVRHSPMASMSKARKIDPDSTATVVARETLIGIASQSSAAKQSPMDGISAYFHHNLAQLASQKPSSDGVNPHMAASNSSLVGDPLLLLSQQMLAQQLMQGMQGSNARFTHPSVPAPTNTSTSGLNPTSLLAASPANISGLLLNSSHPQLLAQNPQLLLNYLNEQQRKIQQSHPSTVGNPNTSQTSSLPARGNPVSGAASSPSAVKAPIPDISFPAGAALASQLAGAAILGGKSLTSLPSSTPGAPHNNDTQQRATLIQPHHPSGKKKVCWCNMHVRIAQFIARHQETRRSNDSRKLSHPRGAQPSTSHNAMQQASNSSNVSAIQNIQHLQNFIAAAGLLPPTAVGQPNYGAQVPLVNAMSSQQQQMALLAGMGLLPTSLSSMLAPQSQYAASLSTQAQRQQSQPSALGVQGLQGLPASISGLLPHSAGIAASRPPQFQSFNPQQQQQMGRGAPMQSSAASALGFPVMPMSLGVSGSLTSGTSNAAASAHNLVQQQNPSNASLSKQLTGVGLEGGSVGDTQAAILAQLLLSQLGGGGQLTFNAPAFASGPGHNSTATMSDNQAIAAIASLLGGGSAAPLPTNVLPRAPMNPPSSSYRAPSAAATGQNVQSAIMEAQSGSSSMGDSAAQRPNISMPVTPQNAQRFDRNTQIANMPAAFPTANHYLPSHQQQPSQSKQQLPHPLQLALPQHSATGTNTVAARNVDSATATAAGQKAVGQDTALLNSLFLSPPNSAHLASLSPIEQELFVRYHIYTHCMNQGAAPSNNNAVTLPTFPAGLPVAPSASSTLSSSSTRPTASQPATADTPTTARLKTEIEPTAGRCHPSSSSATALTTSNVQPTSVTSAPNTGTTAVPAIPPPPECNVLNTAPTAPTEVSAATKEEGT